MNDTTSSAPCFSNTTHESIPTFDLISVDFDDIKFYGEDYLPALSEFCALDQLLEPFRIRPQTTSTKPPPEAHFEYTDIAEMYNEARRHFPGDELLHNGYRALLQNFGRISGVKSYVTDSDMLARHKELLIFLLTECLARPGLQSMVSEDLKIILEQITDSDMQVNDLVAKVKAEFCVA